MFKQLPIAPMVLALCLSFIFACQKEQSEQKSPDVLSSEIVTSEPADINNDIDDRDNCCRVDYIGTAIDGGSGDFLVGFIIRTFSGFQYYFKITRLSDGATYTTPLYTQPGGNLCYNNKQYVDLTAAVAAHFFDCRDKYKVECFVVGSTCAATNTSPYFKAGNNICF